MSTPHNSAQKGDIAKLVLMPGDPLRAKKVAETYLEDVVMFNEVRGMYGYTGYYKGNRVSVMGSGMGCASIGIYSYELFKFYDVEAIIRIGSTGGMQPPVDLYDVILATDVYSESTFAYVQSGCTDKIMKPDSQLNSQLEEAAEKLQYELIKGRVYSADVFYSEPEAPFNDSPVTEYNCIAAEMESFALFHNASVLHKKAACLLTVSDVNYGQPKEASPLERQNSFTRMMEIALEVSSLYQ